MQLLFEDSDEGIEKGLSIIKGHVKKLNSDPNKHRLPHMGWKQIKVQDDNRLLKSQYSDQRFYFVHTYHVVPTDKNIITSYCQYGETFVASIEKDNIFGFQFHPEKSHKFGLELLFKFSKSEGRV